nr:hypothetical protein [Tanacetum cinerariifolium]
MIVRLKNVQDKYLIAQQDEQSVSKSRNGFNKNAQWKVEVKDEESLYLKSCYGKYLTASNQPLIPGMIARNLKVTQTQPEKKNTSHLWLPVVQPEPREPHTMWLKTRHGSYLQTHSGPPPLGNMITHDLLRKDGPIPLSKKILWHIEIVDSPSDTWKQSKSIVSKMLLGMKSFVPVKQKDKEQNSEKETKKWRTKFNPGRLRLCPPWACSSVGTWEYFANMVTLISMGRRSCINLLDFMHVKLGNGDKTAFGRIFRLKTSLDSSFRRVLRGGVEQEQFDELSALVHDVILTPMSDRWIWALESSRDFSVASVRKVIDDKSLPEVDSKTRWIKYVPIKVNVHA